MQVAANVSPSQSTLVSQISCHLEFYLSLEEIRQAIVYQGIVYRATIFCHLSLVTGSMHSHTASCKIMALQNCPSILIPLHFLPKSLLAQFQDLVPRIQSLQRTFCGLSPHFPVNIRKIYNGTVSCDSPSRGEYPLLVFLCSAFLCSRLVHSI